MAMLQWIVAAGTAIFVALVGYFQWRTAHQRGALDLFDRRYELFSIFRDAVGQITASSSGFTQQQEREFVQAKERAYFFFGDDVQRYLEQLWGDIVRIRTVDSELPSITDQQTRAAAIQTRRVAFDRVVQFHTAGRPLFGRYMRFSQPMPSALIEAFRQGTSNSNA